jgi:hypothetical protein
MQPMPPRWQGWGHSRKAGWIFGSFIQCWYQCSYWFTQGRTWGLVEIEVNFLAFRQIRWKSQWTDKGHLPTY